MLPSLNEVDLFNYLFNQFFVCLLILPGVKSSITLLQTSLVRCREPNQLALSFFLYLQLFPQVSPVMIKPLREAYENYERMRLKEAVEASEGAAAESSLSENSGVPKKVLGTSRSTTEGQWSPKKTMGVSKEIRDIFHQKTKETKPPDREQELRAMIKTQVP